MRLVLGTRGSRLALAQTQIVERALLHVVPDLDLQREVVKTTGDELPNVSLSGLGRSEKISQGLFVKEIEELLLAGRIDAAVHSLKDMPTSLPADLIIGGCPERGSVVDVLISKLSGGLNNLRRGATVATSSPRRAAQLKIRRPDLLIAPARGNVTTRMEKLIGQEEWDAIILARAGLERLGVLSPEGDRAIVSDERMLWVESLDLEIFLPAPGQGAIAVEVRSKDESTREVVARIDHAATSTAVRAERAWLRGMGGGCHVPMAAYAHVDPKTDQLTLRAADYRGGKGRYMQIEGPASEPDSLGIELAQRFQKESERFG